MAPSVRLVIPVTGLFLLLRAQIVRIVLGQGAFSWDDTIRTADTKLVIQRRAVAQVFTPGGTSAS